MFNLNNPGVAAPTYFGNNWYCESGNPTTNYPHQVLYSNDPLWDGQDCDNREDVFIAVFEIYIR